MPKAQKGSDGYYRLSFTHQGKKYSVRSKNPNKLSAQRTAKIAELGAGVRLINTVTTSDMWTAEWIETYNQGVRKASRTRLSGIVEQYVKKHIGYMTVKDIRPVHCQRVLNGMEGKAKDTIKKVRSLLYNMFVAALDNSLCKTNPVEKLTLPNTAAQSTHRSITDRERKIIIKTANTHPAGPWVLLLLYTGLRPAESVVLTGADVVGNMVRVNKAYDRNTRAPKEPKSDAGHRKVPITQALRAVLPDVGITDLLFPAPRGGVRDHNSVAK